MTSWVQRVNEPAATENGAGQAAALELAEGAALHDELTPALDERTIRILERRRRTVRRRGWLVRRLLLAADLTGLALAFLVSELLFINLGVSPEAEVILFVASLPLWVVAAKLFGLYDRDEELADYSSTDDFVRVFLLVTVGVFLFTRAVLLFRLADPNLTKLTVFWAVAIGLVTANRVVARAAARQCIGYLQNTVIVGAGDVGQLVARKLLKHPEYGLNLIGFVDAEPKERRDDLEHLTLLGPPERLPAIVRMFDVERVVVAFSTHSTEQILHLIRSLKNLDVQVDVVPRFFEIVGTRVAMHTIEGVPLVGLPPLRLSPSSRLLKRAMDLLLAVIGLVLLTPVFALLALLIRLDSRGPVFFRQVRMGADDKTFQIYKFRTMIEEADRQRAELRADIEESGGENGLLKLRNDPRTTRLGRRLRRYSLDELPQLINVVKGEMSLVGPRPLPLDEDENVCDWGRRRLALKPGITGLWQVLGRSEIPFDEMLTLDYVYVTSWSLFNDLKLIFRTVPVLFQKRGAY